MAPKEKRVQGHPKLPQGASHKSRFQIGVAHCVFQLVVHYVDLCIINIYWGQCYCKEEIMKIILRIKVDDTIENSGPTDRNRGVGEFLQLKLSNQCI